MRDPFDVAAPMPPGDDDREFDDAPADGRTLPDEIADAHRPLRNFGTSDPWIERPPKLAVSARRACAFDTFVLLLLLRRQFGEGFRLQSAGHGCHAPSVVSRTAESKPIGN